jgi:hypothetical protein
MKERKRKLASPQVVLGLVKYGSYSDLVEFLHKEGGIYNAQKEAKKKAQKKIHAGKKAKALAIENVVLHLRQEAMKKKIKISTKQIAEKAGTSVSTVSRIFARHGFGKFKRK